LKSKKKQAELAIKLQEGLYKKFHGGKGYTVPPELITIREKQKIELNLLKGTSGHRVRPPIH
jgi:hypothetical protein